MRLQICAVGRLRVGPERDLIDDYVTRFDRVGRGLSLGPLSEVEVAPRKGADRDAEAAALLKVVPAGSTLMALDERGKTLSSPDLAARIATFRDGGAQDLVFVIGGADGLGADVVSRSAGTLSLGRMVWPHMLARVMLAEQLYRAASILAGTPYHRA